jgi:hypothetical protein
MARRVRAKALYLFDPVGWDRCNPPYGVARGILRRGDVVRVVNLPSCPRANTMGHAYIETASGIMGEFAGLVHTNSLLPECFECSAPARKGCGCAWRKS